MGELRARIALVTEEREGNAPRLSNAETVPVTASSTNPTLPWRRFSSAKGAIKAINSSRMTIAAKVRRANPTRMLRRVSKRGLERAWRVGGETKRPSATCTVHTPAPNPHQKTAAQGAIGYPQHAPIGNASMLGTVLPAQNGTWNCVAESRSRYLAVLPP